MTPIADFQALLELVDVSLVSVTQAEARVGATLSAENLPEGCSLAGSVYGPHSVRAATLPFAVKFLPKLGTDAGPGGPRLLAEAIVPDPMFWSDDEPFLYRVRVELVREKQTLAAITRPIGIRLADDERLR